MVDLCRDKYDGLLLGDEGLLVVLFGGRGDGENLLVQGDGRCPV